MVDNGSEFTERSTPGLTSTVSSCTSSAPGHPVENAYIESFNGKFRDECLNENWFIGLDDARVKITGYRTDYNEVRPHSSPEQPDA